MSEHSLRLSLLPGRYSVWKLPPEAPLPACSGEGLFSVTRTPDEVSVVSREEHVPAGVRCEKAWRCLAVAGPLAFELTGVLESLAAPLAAAAVSVFALSTYETDYLLVKETQLGQAIAALETAGHTLVAVRGTDPTLDLVRFIRHTLSCGCPPEVFASIEVRLHPGELAGVPIEASIDVGSRLLVLVLGAGAVARLERSLPEVLARVRAVRDDGGFNRARLVMAPASDTDPADGLHERFRLGAGADDRLHLHVIHPEDLPDLGQGDR